MDRQTAEIVATLTMEGHTDKAQEILAAEGVEITAVGRGGKRGPAKGGRKEKAGLVLEPNPDAADEANEIVADAQLALVKVGRALQKLEAMVQSGEILADPDLDNASSLAGKLNRAISGLSW